MCSLAVAFNGTAMLDDGTVVTADLMKKISYKLTVFSTTHWQSPNGGGLTDSDCFLLCSAAVLLIACAFSWA